MSISFAGQASTGENPERFLLRLAPSTSTLQTSATLAMNELVARRKAAGQATIHLGFGEALMPLHPFLEKALTRAASQTRYAPIAGMPALREAIAAYLARTRSIACTADQVVVAPGSKALLYALLQILAGDVLLPVPSWVSYAPMVELTGRRVIKVATASEDAHRLTPQALEQATSQARKEGGDPRILLVNSPSNPSGSMFERTEVEMLAHWAREEGITLISDEIYAELAHGWREHVSPALFYSEGCVVTGGLSKTFAAGGWRLGYAVFPATGAGEQAMAAVRALASEIWSTAATPVQEAAIAAFTPNLSIEHYVQSSARVYGFIADRLYTTLTQLGVLCPYPAGGFYLYPDFSPWRQQLQQRGVSTSEELARYLLDEWDIATLPGSVFNEDPSTLRLRLATSQLCEPENVSTKEDRDTALWRVLELAGTWSHKKDAHPLSHLFPALARAQARWTEAIGTLEG